MTSGMRAHTHGDRLLMYPTADVAAEAIDQLRREGHGEYGAVLMGLGAVVHSLQQYPGIRGFELVHDQDAEGEPIARVYYDVDEALRDFDKADVDLRNINVGAPQGAQSGQALNQ